MFISIDDFGEVWPESLLVAASCDIDLYDSYSSWYLDVLLSSLRLICS